MSDLCERKPTFASSGIPNNFRSALSSIDVHVFDSLSNSSGPQCFNAAGVVTLIFLTVCSLAILSATAGFSPASFIAIQRIYHDGGG